MPTSTIRRRQDILEGNLPRILLILAIPVMLDNFMNAIFNLIDTFFVSGIGLDTVAAVTFVGPFNDIVKAIGSGLSITGTIMIGRAIGKADKEEENCIIKYLMIIAMIAGVVITVCIYFRWKSILISASITDSLLPVAGKYFKMTSLSTPIIFINAIYFGQKQAQGDTTRILRINAYSIVLKIITTYLLIYQFKFGLISLAVSTFLSQMFILVYAWVSLSYGFVMVNQVIIRYGDNVLAAYGITNRINSVLFSTVAGIGTGLAIIITQNLAQNQTARVKVAIKLSMLIAVILSTVVGFTLLLFKIPVANVMTRGDADVLRHTLNAMSVYSISVIPWAVFQVIIGIFQGYGKTKYNLLISFMRVYLFRLPIYLT
ncbi:MAG: efflux family protein [Lachnospiraceae bacterium]|nr:efflux family protein [Lachnospiraceae bacterium]